jgi:hypothetical protein
MPGCHLTRGARAVGALADAQEGVTFFLLITVHVTDYHWDRHLYFVIHPHHAQTMTHTPPSDDSILVRLLVVLVACVNSTLELSNSEPV